MNIPCNAVIAAPPQWTRMASFGTASETSVDLFTLTIRNSKVSVIPLPQLSTRPLYKACAASFISLPQLRRKRLLATATSDDNGVAFTKEDLISLAYHKDVNHEDARKIFDYMVRKNMILSPSYKRASVIPRQSTRAEETATSEDLTSLTNRFCQFIKRTPLFCTGDKACDSVIPRPHLRRLPWIIITLTKEDLISWANRLYKDGNHGLALKIFDLMDEKKIVFSASGLALYLDLLAKTKGLAAAEAYFKKVEPEFNDQDTHAKNWPAFATLVRLTKTLTT